MGVYIKGMEMPKNCESCQFRRCISDLIMFSWVGCQLDVGIAKKESFKGRHPDCPLVEVKAPHGRLGDLDALMNEMDKQENALYEHGHEFSFSFKSGGDVCTAWYNVEMMVEDAPTIIPAEDGEP